jgi:hypothetical protein
MRSGYFGLVSESEPISTAALRAAANDNSVQGTSPTESIMKII